MNDEQRAAILAPMSPVKVLAGPGSGKTRVLVGRVTHLINECGVPPSHILCITFTNKAAREMKERLELSVGAENANAVTSGTFHSVACRMLRKHVHLLETYGRGNDFAIYDESDSRALIRKILIDRFNEDQKKVDAGLVKGRISASKSAVDHCVNVTGERMLRALLETRPNLKHDPGVTNQFARTYDEYEANLRSSNALDFDDLLSAAVALLQKSDEARQHYQQKWRHVLVDEFQDTSLSQYELIRVLAKPQDHVFVVGDVDQAIYSWRGAEVANIRDKFDVDFPNPTTVLLTKNYRSTSTIVKAARAVIGESKHRSPLDLDAVTPGGKDVAVVAVEDEIEEAEFCAREALKAHRDEGVPLKEIAVLYRTHSQSRPLEEAFIRAGVPHVVVGDTAFYTRKEIKDCVAYLRVLSNPRDTVSFSRIVNTPPRKIGPGTVDKLHAWAESLPWDDGVPLTIGAALLRRRWADPDVPDDQMLPSPESMGLGKAAHRSVCEFVRLMRDLEDFMDVSSPGELLQEVVDKVGFEAYVSEQDNGDERLGFIKELISVANDSNDSISVPGSFSASEAVEVTGVPRTGFDRDPTRETRDDPDADGSAAIGVSGVFAFLEGISLLTSAETRSEDETADAVRLMTLHASKGLEFHTVLVSGCEDGLIPFKRDERTGQPEDEETRLFYVGVTRAKRKVFLCRAFRRRRFGKTEYCDPSPYLDVIKDALAPGGSNGRLRAEIAAAGRYGSAERAGKYGNGSREGSEEVAGRDERLAALLSGAAARAAMGNSPAFRGRGYPKGAGERGGGGGGRGSSAPNRVETIADPEANARRAGRRAAAAKKAARSALKKSTGEAPGPRAAPRGKFTGLE
jgi:DNA helicase-2/ATP-dependent DNA helicase PcrA